MILKIKLALRPKLIVLALSKRVLDSQSMINGWPLYNKIFGSLIQGGLWVGCTKACLLKTESTCIVNGLADKESIEKRYVSS